jgi:hypothetical protein
MPDEQKTQLRLEIAHVLFMDIVGYSKLLIDEQSEALQELNQIVHKTDAVRAAEAAGQLIFLPTGDGMALVFTDPSKIRWNAPQISQRPRAQACPCAWAFTAARSITCRCEPAREHCRRRH